MRKVLKTRQVSSNVTVVKVIVALQDTATMSRGFGRTHDNSLSTFQIDLTLVHEMLSEDATSEGPMTRSKARRQMTESMSDSIPSTSEGERSRAVAPGDQSPVSPDDGPEGQQEQFEIIPSTNKELGTKTAILLLLMIFLTSALSMVLVLKTFPDMNDEDRNSIKFPNDLDDAKELGQVLSRYKDQYFLQVSIFRVFFLSPSC